MKLHFEFNPFDDKDVVAATEAFKRLMGASLDPSAPVTMEEIPLPTLALADIPPPPTTAPDMLGFTASNEPPAPPAPTSGVELDTAGLPWDGRIHSETKSKTQSGEWRGRRGVDKALVAQVEAELRGRPLSAAAPAATQGALDTPPPPTTAPVEPPADIPPPPAAPVQGSPVQQVDAMAGAAPSVKTFPELVVYISGRFKAGTLTPDQTIQVANMYGFEAVPGFMSKPDLIPEVVAILEAM